MSEARRPHFGVRVPGRGYIERPGAYGIAIDRRGRVLVIEIPMPGWRWRILPGGGIDAGESPEQALVREVAEETGFAATVQGFIGEAVQSLYAPEYGEYYDKICRYYRIALSDDARRRPIEPGYAPRWLDARSAADTLTEPAQRWAVAMALAGA